MATQPQNSTAIPYRKRIAMGEKLDGTSLQPKQQQPQKGGLSQTKKK
jgi:hypothetical protein